MIKIADAAYAYKPMCFSTSAIAPSFTTTTSIATTKTSNMDHLPTLCKRVSVFSVTVLVDELLYTRLASMPSLKIGKMMLNKEMIKHKNNCPSFKRFQVPERIEKVFCMKMNFLKVMIGAIKPTASKIAAINKSISNNILWEVTCNFI